MVHRSHHAMGRIPAGRSHIRQAVDRRRSSAGAATALGVEEVLFARRGRLRAQAWLTSILDVAQGQLIDVIEGRSSTGLCAWITRTRKPDHPE